MAPFIFQIYYLVFITIKDVRHYFFYYVKRSTNLIQISGEYFGSIHIKHSNVYMPQLSNDIFRNLW